ncbi:MAG TPA: transposase [Steroidobacteraceae bacterium]
MERIKRRRLSASAWRGMLARFASSGLTVQAFCRREAVSTASFYRWRSRLEATFAGEGPRQEAAVAVSPTPEFVDLGTLRPTTTSSRCELRLDLGGGVLLHLVRG